METSLVALWLPIIVSGIALFFASFAAWMLLPHHKGEWKGLPNEDAIIAALKNAGVGCGQFMFPYSANPEDWKTEAFKAKMQAGPNGNMVVWSGACNMGKNMLHTVIFFTVVSAVIAYLAGIALPPGAEFMRVFRFVGTAGIVTYGSANVLNGIWFGRKLLSDIGDGIAYGVITGLIFAALWPGATV